MPGLEQPMGTAEPTAVKSGMGPWPSSVPHGPTTVQGWMWSPAWLMQGSINGSVWSWDQKRFSKPVSFPLCPHKLRCTVDGLLIQQPPLCLDALCLDALWIASWWAQGPHGTHRAQCWTHDQDAGKVCQMKKDRSKRCCCMIGHRKPGSRENQIRQPGRDLDDPLDSDAIDHEEAQRSGGQWWRRKINLGHRPALPPRPAPSEKDAGLTDTLRAAALIHPSKGSHRTIKQNKGALFPRAGFQS